MLLQAGDRDVAEEARANRFGAEAGGDPDGLGRELVGAGGGDEQCPRSFRADVDRRTEHDLGRPELGPVERVGDIVRVGIAEEAKRHVPVLRSDEAGTDLVFAVQPVEYLRHIVGRPEADEQSAHPRSLATSADGSAPRFGETVEVEVSIGRRPDAAAALARLADVLATMPERVVACSGGIDSLVLATVAAREPGHTRVAHTATPAVPGDATARVVDHAERNGWQLDIVRSGEFDDERYLSNPTERCYFCKSNLYDAISALLADQVAAATSTNARPVVVSGANTDDLGEYRPGLEAAAERDVRHPFVEAGVGKPEIRAIARHLGMAEADLPASPCLASRLYTGTRVTASKLRAVEAGEALLRDRCAIGVVRCRVRDDDLAGGARDEPSDHIDGEVGLTVLVEVPEVDRPLVTELILADVAAVMRSVEPSIARVQLDDQPYAPGRSFVGAASAPGQPAAGQPAPGQPAIDPNSGAGAS